MSGLLRHGQPGFEVRKDYLMDEQPKKSGKRELPRDLPMTAVSPAEFVESSRRMRDIVGIPDAPEGFVHGSHDDRMAIARLAEAALHDTSIFARIGRKLRRDSTDR
jgi:hypothetical protein